MDTLGAYCLPGDVSVRADVNKEDEVNEEMSSLSRDEAAIQNWKEQRWNALKKAKDEQRTIVFVDESAFYLLPMAVRTYAPVGQTPTLRVKLSRDHLSAIGGITPKGRIFMQTQDHSYKSPDVVRFLRLLLREVPGKLLVSLRWSPIHRRKAHQRLVFQKVEPNASISNACQPMPLS